MALSLVTAAAAEPVTLDELKLHIKQDINADDDTLIALIKAARRQVEIATRRQLYTATWRQSLDRFPWWSGGPILLDIAPVASVSSITYIDTNGTTQTWGASNYIVDTYSEPCRITPAYSVVWPTTRTQINAVTIQFVAGYGVASAVPEQLKLAVKMLAAHWYENREATGDVLMHTVPIGVEHLMRAESYGAYA